MSGCFDDPKEVFERPFCVHAVSKAWEGVAEVTFAEKSYGTKPAG